MSDPAPSNPAAPVRDSVFTKGFLPGLVIGLLVGLAVGAFVPPLLTREKLPPPDPNVPKHSAADRERLDVPPGEQLPTKPPEGQPPSATPPTPPPATGVPAKP